MEKTRIYPPTVDSGIKRDEIVQLNYLEGNKMYAVSGFYISLPFLNASQEVPVKFMESLSML